MKRILLPLALLTLCQGVMAQQPPGAGSQLQQIPPPPAQGRLAPEIRIEQRASPATASAGQARILVNALRLTGAQQYPEAELLALTGFTPGQELTLADLQDMAARITGHYRRHGYFVAFAYLPAQEIKDNAVTMAVSEGRYGQVTVRNQSNLSDRLASGSMDGIQGGDLITTGPLETRLLLLSDLPGVSVTSTLVPGMSHGTSDLIVDVVPGRRVTGSVDADNGGNRYTGAVRVGATVNLNNPLGLGDVASLRVVSSGSGLNYARASYQIQVGRGQVGVAYSGLRYALGREFESLQAHGTAQVASVYGRYPLVRSRHSNLYAQLAYDARTFQDKIDSIPAVTDRKAGVLMASLYGDHGDSWGALPGQTSFSLTASSGTLDIRTPAALAADALGPRSNGHYGKLAFSLQRVQALGGPFSLFAGISGQTASKNLDSSEKMALGGMHAVRAYPEGEADADEGLLLTLEARLALAPVSPQQPGQVQLIVFADAGKTRVNRNPWAGGQNHRTLSGAGVGVTWSAPGNFLVRASYARKLGGEPATSAPDRSGRIWLQAVKYF